MPFNNRFDRRRMGLNSLSFSQTQVNFILGHSLASIYQDVLKQPIPAHLMALINRLDRGDA
jgi:hypothetical protein